MPKVTPSSNSDSSFFSPRKVGAIFGTAVAFWATGLILYSLPKHDEQNHAIRDAAAITFGIGVSVFVLPLLYGFGRTCGNTYRDSCVQPEESELTDSEKLSLIH